MLRIDGGSFTEQPRRRKHEGHGASGGAGAAVEIRVWLRGIAVEEATDGPNGNLGTTSGAKRLLQQVRDRLEASGRLSRRLKEFPESLRGASGAMFSHPEAI